jgi:hypothetical protein
VAKVYLETSFFSACVSTRKSDKSLGWRASSIEWWESQAPRFELFITSEVIRELSDPAFPHSKKAIAMLRDLSVLRLTPETFDLADLLVREKLMPVPAVSGDALHVAAATIHGMDYLLTWNQRHLANPNKRTHFSIVCMRLGLTAPQLVTPDLLQGD